MNEETSESGSPIYRHTEPAKRGWTPPGTSGSSLKKISRQIETHIGKIDTVWHEVLSDLVHIDVHTISPTPLRPYYTLVTSGMSDLPMTAPASAHERRFAELMLCLPATWPMTQQDWQEEKHYWPIRMLKYLARFPHEYATWLSWGHTVPNGDPPQPFATTTQLSCALLAHPMTVSREFSTLAASPEKTIHFYSVLPLHPDELEFKLTQGAEALVELLERTKVTELLDPTRRSVVRKPWWKLF